MTRIDKLKHQITELRMQEVRAASHPTDLPKIRAKRLRLEAELETLLAAEPRRLAEAVSRQELDRAEIVDWCIMTHMAADVLCECSGELRERLEKLGIVEVNIFPLLREIERLSADFAAIVCHPEFAGLQDLMVTNSRLLEDLILLMRRYIKQHLKVIKN